MLDPSNPRDVLAFRVDFEDRVAVLVVLLQAVPAGDAAIEWLPQHRAHVDTAHDARRPGQERGVDFRRKRTNDDQTWLF
jgi:hypothetical protein